MKDLGKAAFILGIKIYQDRSNRLIGLIQSAYMDKILKRYRMDNSKRGNIPIQERLDLNKTQGSTIPREVNRMKKCEPHETAVKNILNYLRNTKDMFLVYGGNPEAELRVDCYCDAGFETNRDDIKSQTGYVFILNGGAVDWKSSKQSTTAMSATEAEYIAASEAAMEAVWIRKFISGLGIVPTINEPIKMFCDNSAALLIANEPGVQRGARHYHRRYHYVRECIELGEINLLKVHTDDNLADPFTKALSKGKLTQHARSMGLRLASSFIRENSDKEHDENVENVEEQKADEEQKGDDQTEDDQVGVSVTNKEKPDLPQSNSSHSISSNYGNQFLNISPNVSLIGTIQENAKAEINSLLDIQIQQEVIIIQKEPLHEVNVSVIPNPTQIPPSTPPTPTLPATEKDVKELKQVDHSLAILESIKSLVPSAIDKYLGSTLGDTHQKVLQRHTEELIHQYLQKDVPEIIKVKQECASKEKMPKYSTTPFDQAADDEYIFYLWMRMTWIDLMWILFLRRRRHEDKEQDPPTGSDQGMKKRRTRKYVEPSMKSLKSLKSKESAKGKTPSNTSKTGKFVSIEKLVHEPEHVVLMDDEEPNLDNVANDADEPQADATPKIPKQDWFKKPSRLETPDPDWNTVKTVNDAPEQSGFKEMIQAEKPPLTFDELMSTPIDFTSFAMNRLKLDTITRADLVGLVFNLLKGTCKSCLELEYNMEEYYRALIDQLDWTTPEGHKSPVDMSKPLPSRKHSSSITKTPAARYKMEGIEDLIPTLWSPVTIAYDKDAALGISLWTTTSTVLKSFGDQKLYKFKEGDFPDLHLNDIEDMLLLIAQNKLFNLEDDVIMDFVIALKMFTRRVIVQNRVEDVQLGVESYQRKLNLTKPQRTCPLLSAKEPYTPNFDPPRVIYEDKSKKKRLMRVDEVYKFCDGTLQSVRNILRQRLQNFRLGYNNDMPSRQRTNKDKRRTSIILNKIDDQLLKRRIMRSLEVLVGRRKTETDKRLL
ncbi:hypothetical protein Tco_0517810 [Tanacetum coccineum]